MKKNDYISWDEYFMWVAILSWHRSKDPWTQVWACIIDIDKKIVWVWYNWLPTWCDDDCFPWQRDGDFEETKYAYVCHAEANAILNSTKTLKWATIYVSLFPCNECAKLIIQSWIKKIVYLSDKYTWTPANNASKKMLDASWIIYTQLETKLKDLSISFTL